MGDVSLWEQVCQQFDRAAACTGHPAGILAQIRACNHVYRMAFPIKRDDGSVAGDQRVARRAQPPQAADQGRHPLQPDGQRGRGHGPGRAHDLQVRGRRRPVRRGQGRRPDRGPRVLDGRARAHHPALHLRAGPQEVHRTRGRRAGARLRHRPARDGVDRRHLPGPDRGRARLAGLRHRQAGRPGRHPRPQRGDRARRLLRHPRGRRRRRGHEAARPDRRARRQAGRGPGPGQRRLPRRQVPRRGRRASWSALAEYDGAITNPDGLDLEDVVRYRTEHGTLLGYPRGQGPAQPRGRARARLRHPDPGRARGRDHGRQRRTGSRPRSSARPPTGRSPPRPTRSCPSAA